MCKALASDVHPKSPQLQSLDEEWQAERSGLRERLERLQKVRLHAFKEGPGCHLAMVHFEACDTQYLPCAGQANRQRRQEADDMQAQLAATQDIAERGQQVIT